MMYFLNLPERKSDKDMNKMFGLIRRNLLVYFKDKSAVVFSMLTPIIMLVLYMFFLRGNFVNGIESAAQQVMGLINPDDISAFANGMLLAGILSSAMITVPYNTLSTIVSDRETKVDFDISATPIKRVQIILAYYVASALSAFIMTTIILVLGIIVISLNSSMYIGGVRIAALFLVAFLGSVSGTAIFMPVMVILKKSSAVSAFMGIISAASGFVIGAYIPLSEFSDGIQNFCNLFPATGITVILKRLILTGLVDNMDNCIGGLDNGMFARIMREEFGFYGQFFGNTLSITQTTLYVSGVTLLFIIAIAVLYPRVYKKK